MKKDLLTLRDITRDDLEHIFELASKLKAERGKTAFTPLAGKSVGLIFAKSSTRTRVSFEVGVGELGGRPLYLDQSKMQIGRGETVADTAKVLSRYLHGIVIRTFSHAEVEELAREADIPVINALTDANHPCEMAADLYALSKIRNDFTMDHFLFCGVTGNIGLAWKEASEVMGFSLEQCCIPGYEMNGVPSHHCIRDAIRRKDIICTDSLPADLLSASRGCTVDLAAMKLANEGAILNPCPPFYRGEEVSNDVIDSDYFVGYEFKKHLLTVQQAIMVYCLTH